MELSDIKGFGPKRITILQGMGINNPSDLLFFYPSSYMDYSTCTPVAALEDGEKASVAVTISSKPSWYARNGLNTVTVYGKDEAGKTLALRYFNQPYRAKGLEMGESFIASGRVHIGERGAPTLLNPSISHELRGIVPVYTLPKGLTQSSLRSGILAALHSSPIEETLPESLIQKHGFPSRREMLTWLHFPTERTLLQQARRRRAYEDALLYFLASWELSENRLRKNGTPLAARQALPVFLKTLPFTPTEAQMRVLEEVAEDMEHAVPMNRLVEGDVGSGKTIIALFALFAAASQGYQGAFLAPTEILARQHYESLSTLFPGRCGLLLGSDSPAQKKEALACLQSGRWLAVTGTHVLFSQRVRFNKLGVVITDEQHRFGVCQRAAMEEKGRRPHVLVMSATPIPRTLALIMYGDLSLSRIDQLPAGRKPVRTHLVGESKRADMYRYLAKQAQAGQQSYVVCPLIEKTEGLEGLSVEEIFQEIKPWMEQVVVEKLHSRMSEEEKQAVMNRFKRGEISILVATTVIEVGIHVPQATSMVIEGAERFGLATLHQLRGRVGRGTEQAHCYLVVYEQKKPAKERLKAMLETNDGFTIAERDFQLRGAGDIMGIRQAGERREEIFWQDCTLSELEAAKEDAREIWDVPSERNNLLLGEANKRFGALSHITMN